MQYISSNSDNSMGSSYNVNYTFNFILGHDIPYYGAIAIIFPQQYEGDLLTIGVKCQLSGKFSQ